MASFDNVNYRLKLADGFLGEARLDVGIARWSSGVDNSQLASENATKAVLALLGPVGRSHSPADLLKETFQDGSFPSELSVDIQRLVDLSKHLGWSVHVESDYCDENRLLTPWELIDEARARSSLKIAEEVLILVRRIVDATSSSTE